MKWLVYVENWVYLGATVLALSHAWREWTGARAERLRHAAEDIKFYDALAKRSLRSEEAASLDRIPSFQRLKPL